MSDVHPRPAGDVIVYELRINADGSAGTTVHRSQDDYTNYAILGSGQAEILARQQLRDPTKAKGVVELMAMHDMGAHAIVTADAAILAHKNEGWLKDLNIVTTGEALVLAGLWSRACGSALLAPPDPPALWMYYWGLARAVTPAGWFAFTAWLEGERTFPQGRLLFDLASSVLERLSTNVRAIDRLALLWLQPVSNLSELEISAELENLLLRTWAIQDNLALLAGKHLGLPLRREVTWSLINDEWIAAMRSVGNRGERLADLAVSLGDRLRIAQEFRHHAAHRAMLRPIVAVSGSEPDLVRISVPGETADKIRNYLGNLGEVAEDWGLAEEVAETTGTSTIHKRDGTVEQHIETFPRTVYLDPIPFAIRLVASTALVVDKFFESLEPETDERLSAKQRESIAESRPPDWGVGMRAFEIVITSPLAGLTPWVSRAPGP